MLSRLLAARDRSGLDSHDVSARSIQKKGKVMLWRTGFRLLRLKLFVHGFNPKRLQSKIPGQT
jgi:hypothetical protein